MYIHIQYKYIRIDGSLDILFKDHNGFFSYKELCAYVCMYIYKCMCVCVCVCACIYMYVCLCVCVCVCVCLFKKVNGNESLPWNL